MQVLNAYLKAPDQQTMQSNVSQPQLTCLESLKTVHSILLLIEPPVGETAPSLVILTP